MVIYYSSCDEWLIPAIIPDIYTQMYILWDEVPIMVEIVWDEVPTMVEIAIF